MHICELDVNKCASSGACFYCLILCLQDRWKWPSLARLSFCRSVVGLCPACLPILLLVGARATCGSPLSRTGSLGHRACTCLAFLNHGLLLSRVVETICAPTANGAGYSSHQLSFLAYPLSAVYISASLVGKRCLRMFLGHLGVIFCEVPVHVFPLFSF